MSSKVGGRGVNVAVGSGDGVAVGAVEVGSIVNVCVGEGVAVGSTVDSDVGVDVGKGIGGVRQLVRNPTTIIKNNIAKRNERSNVNIQFLSLCALV